MDIGGALLYNAYAGNYASGAGSRSPRESQSAGASEQRGTGDGRFQNTDATRGELESTNIVSKHSHDPAPSTNGSGGNVNDTATRLTEEDLKAVRQLKQRDREVRAHEAAHLAAAGKYATGGASFEFRRGPDGKSYAVGGEVGIDVSPVPNDPQATIEKARQIKAAANAPASPSSADRQVAASASRMEAEAQRELAEVRLEEREASAAASEKTESDEAGNKGLETGAMNNTAASVYREFEELFRNGGESAKQIDLTA